MWHEVLAQIVDDGNKVVFGLTESYIEHVATGQSIPTRQTHGVFFLLLDARLGTRPPRRLANH